MKGIKIARPGSSIRLNFPIRSTIHAVCCGTNRTTVFVGKRLCDPKYEGGPACELSCPKLKMLAGFEDEADCEFSCVKLRVYGALKIVASGAVLEASGLELLSKLEAVEATNRLRDAIIEVEANVE